VTVNLAGAILSRLFQRLLHNIPEFILARPRIRKIVSGANTYASLARNYPETIPHSLIIIARDRRSYPCREACEQNHRLSRGPCRM